MFEDHQEGPRDREEIPQANSPKEWADLGFCGKWGRPYGGTGWRGEDWGPTGVLPDDDDDEGVDGPSPRVEVQWKVSGVHRLHAHTETRSRAPQSRRRL